MKSRAQFEKRSHLPVGFDGPRIGKHQPGGKVQYRALSRSVRTDQPQTFAGRDFERNILERFKSLGSVEPMPHSLAQKHRPAMMRERLGYMFETNGAFHQMCS